MQLKAALKEENLKEAFDFYDQDKDGQITLSELQKVFGGLCEEQALLRLIQEVDANHDNQVLIKNNIIIDILC